MKPVIILPCHGRHGMYRPPPWWGHAALDVPTLFDDYRRATGEIRPVVAATDFDRLYQVSAGESRAVLLGGRPGVFRLARRRYFGQTTIDSPVYQILGRAAVGPQEVP